VGTRDARQPNLQVAHTNPADPVNAWRRRADAVALLILPAALNGNEVLPGSTSGANEMSLIARFHPLQFDVLVESNDDPFSPIALTGLIEKLTVVPWTGLTMTRGGDATLTGIGDAMSTTLVYAFSRSTVAEFSFGPSFAANASGLMGGSMPDS
jgi:hypothetical protein